MILLVFVEAVLVSVIFERQARRHRIQIAVEYERLGIPLLPRRPKLKRAEAWLNVGLGVLLVAISLFFIWVGIQMRDVAEHMPDHAPTFNDSAVQEIAGGAFFLAGGIALAWLGWKATREIRRYESDAASVSGPPGTERRFSATK